MRQPTKEAARGKWLGILAVLLHDSPRYTKRRHGPCPRCGGTDRYRFDDHLGNGNWFCNVCGVGDGFDLLAIVNGWDFKTAAAEVDKIVNNIEAHPFKPQIDVETRRDLLNDVWLNARRPDILTAYIVSRGLSVVKLGSKLRDLRGTGRLIDVDHGRVERDGIVALVRNAADDPITIHRTFIKTPEYSAMKKLMPPIDEIKGSVIKLGDLGEQIVIGEGIETTLAGCQAFECPGVCTITAGNMVEYKPPGFVKRVVILADNDQSFTGQAKAFELAFHLRNLRKMEVEVAMPQTSGDDFCDYVAHGGELLMWKGGTPS